MTTRALRSAQLAFQDDKRVPEIAGLDFNRLDFLNLNFY